MHEHLLSLHRISRADRVGFAEIPREFVAAAKPRVSFWDAALERSLKAFLVKFLSRKKLYIIEMENAKHFTY